MSAAKSECSERGGDDGGRTGPGAASFSSVEGETELAEWEAEKPLRGVAKRFWKRALKELNTLGLVSPAPLVCVKTLRNQEE